MKTVASALLSSLDGITACFTTRHGGVSKAPYSQANLAFHVGDDPEIVLRNHELLARALGYEHSRLIHMRQIHSDRVVAVDETFDFHTPPECDALITNRPHIPLMVMSADCTPILLVDPLHRAIGAVHAGRAGALSAILPKTIETMARTYGSRLGDLRISLGPSIHGCCYEINSDIASETEAKGYKKALRKEGEKFFLDVNTILLMQLESLGIGPGQIERIDHCTSCRCDTYFSYRADRQQTGRIAGVIMLRR